MSQADHVDIFEVVAILWRRRWLILSIILVFGVTATTYALLAKPWYRADVVVVKARGGALPGGLARLGGLAGLAGIEIGGDSESREPLAVLKSRDFARQFIEDRDLLPTLFAEQWDSGNERWKSGNSADHPDIRDAVKYFDEVIRTVVEDNNSGLVTLSITWTDPGASAEWANELIVRANLRMQEQALEEAERNVNFLKAQLSSTSVPALQSSVGEVLEREMQQLLLARGNKEYAFKVVDKAFPPKRKVKPRRFMIVGASLLFGALVGVTVAFALNAVERRGRSQRALQMGAA